MSLSTENGLRSARAVGRRRDQQNMTRRMVGQRPQKLVALLLHPAAAARPRRHVRLVDVHEVGRVEQEQRPVPVRLHEVDAGDQVVVVGADRDVVPR